MSSLRKGVFTFFEKKTKQNKTKQNKKCQAISNCAQANTDMKRFRIDLVDQAIQQSKQTL